MDVKPPIDTSKFDQLSSGVWAFKDMPRFSYSDGVATERYLKKVFSESKDLGCRSEQLRGAIKDWPTEYHLSAKRSQLLSGFDYGKSGSVLEVGCGCGAITRFLGEQFASVTSVEGSLVRAELARLRCRDLPNVEIVCSPFQSVEFSEKFDIVFCIGVLEYSASFVDSDSPYSDVIDVFADVLKPSGTVIIAIENQFGMKYLNGCREDHVGLKYEGIEGYARSQNKVRTFGKSELNDLVKTRFQSVDFYYPYPDYKVPDCVLSEEFLASPESADLVSQNRSRDYVGRREPEWDESLVAVELAKNRMLHLVADSFLVVASKAPSSSVTFPQRGILFASDRRSQFESQSRIVGTREKAAVEKRRLDQDLEPRFKNLRMEETVSDWVNGVSLFTELYRRAVSGETDLSKIFEPCQSWYSQLALAATEVDGTPKLSGSLIDATWGNSYLDNNRCQFIDTEWRWESEVPLNAVVIRSIYIFLERCHHSTRLAEQLRARRAASVIKRVAASFDVLISSEDLRTFVALESRLQHCARNADESRTRLYLRLYMIDRMTLKSAMRNANRIRRFASRVISRVGRMFGNP